MKNVRIKLLLTIIFISTLGMVACNLGPALMPPTQDWAATSVHLTTEAIFSQQRENGAPTDIVLASPTAPSQETPLPTETFPPTSDTEPTATPEIEDNRIRFAPGTTFATIRGEVFENEPVEYLLQISAGQMLSVYIESDDKTPVLALSGEDGQEILSASYGYVWYITTVQKTQDYIVRIVPLDKHARYILHAATLIDVEFDTGATSKTFQGMVGPDDMVDFRAYALEGQKARVTLTSTSDQASLHIIGLNDLNHFVERRSRATSWEATLPESQNYLIRVLANESAAEFTLKIEFLNQ